MSKGLVMSAVIAALSSGVSASVDNAFVTTSAFRMQEVVDCSEGVCVMESTHAEQSKEIIEQIRLQTKKWRDLASKVEASNAPESFFSQEDVKSLLSADLYVRSGEQMLRLQYEDLANSLPEGDAKSQILSVSKAIRKEVARLRSSISNLVKLEKQFRPSKKSNYVEQFDMNSESVAMLKEATQRAYFH